MGSCQRARTTSNGVDGAPDGERGSSEGVPPGLWAGSESRRRTGVCAGLGVRVGVPCGAGRLPADRLIELEFGRQFAVLRISDRGLIPIDGVPQGRGTRRGNRRRSGRLTDVEEDAPHRFRLGHRRDQPHFAATGRAEQREDGIDAGEEDRPQVTGRCRARGVGGAGVGRDGGSRRRAGTGPTRRTATRPAP